MTFQMIMMWMIMGGLGLLTVSQVARGIFSKREKVGSLPRREPLWAYLPILGLRASFLPIGVGMSTVVISLVIENSEQIITSVWLGPTLIVAAFVLFIVKKRAGLIYGAIEVCAALGSIVFVTFADQGSTRARLVAAATATYFLIRGLDNFTSSAPFKKYAENQKRLRQAAKSRAMRAKLKALAERPLRR